MDYTRSADGETNSNAGTGSESNASGESESDGGQTLGRLPNRLVPIATLLGSVALVVLVWRFTVDALSLPTVLLPSPSAVWVAFTTHAGSMYPQVVYTGTEILLGWLVGVTGGITLAAIMALSGRLRAVLYPTVLAVRIVPLVVFAPLLVLAFGATLTTRVGIAALLTFFPMTVATLDGLGSVPKTHLDLGQLVDAPAWRLLLSIRLPYALPEVFTGLKIATPLAVEGVLIAEFLAATKGVGFELLETARLLQTPLLFAYLGVLAVGALALFGVVVRTERRVGTSDGTDSLGEAFVTGRTVVETGRREVAGALVALAGILVVWGIAARIVPNASVFLPPPLAVLRTLIESPGLFLHAGYATGTKLLTGWCLGAGVGLALGVCIRIVPGLGSVLYPYLVGFRVMPHVAVAPLLLVWFGVSFEAAVIMIAASTFFPITIGTAAGLAATPDEQLALLRSVDAPLHRELLFVRLRNAVPSLFAGIKLSVVTAVVGTVIAEWFVAERGFGVLVLQGMSDFAPALTFAAAVCLFALGGGLFAIVAALQWYVSW
ncbi:MULTISPECIES: ABC transporter permease subunit [unclassified Haladaptatus]|uniref:ABC transporter permease n=1 Tax=unclassified Haladaptatus TaxID=2622732 RepID=UPI00209BD1BD|nr:MULTISPECIES: ABC transporter permease subunit [unclassified Haladaptatus]MCO8244234.1 ABC transporter permease subunit [Haladaptatus sp. AB643]MCO8256038.1 ABC transporter permease subunit [Haladaptatus sp. AB618]